MNKEKIEYISHLAITVVSIILFLYVFFKYVFGLVLPFVIAWGVSMATRPFAKKLSRGTKIPEKIIRVILTLLLLVGGIAVLISASVYAVREAWDFIMGVIENDSLYDTLGKIMNPLSGLFGDREGAAELEAKIGEAIKSALSSVLSKIVSVVTDIAASIPSALFFILITVISSVYFSYDIDKINSYIKGILPKKISSGLGKFKKKFLDTLIKYLRSYLIIMLITFIVMLFGFLVLRIKYAVLFAFVVALLDALPLIGVGTILIPYSVYHLIFGSFGLGIGIIVLFVSHQLLRQFAEPKIVGKSLGIHPIVSLALLYVGYFVFGFLGLLLIPFLSVVINVIFSPERLNINREK